jgi:hypothetical protein
MKGDITVADLQVICNLAEAVLTDNMLLEEPLPRKSNANTYTPPTVEVSRVSPSPPTSKHPTDTLDTVGASASLLCAIHCAILPLIITVLPLIGLQVLAESWVEWALVCLAAVVGVSSLCFGYREHRSLRALIVLGVGLTLMITGRLVEHFEVGEWGVPVLVLGGLTIAGSHLLNRKLCHDCRACTPATSPQTPPSP